MRVCMCTCACLRGCGLCVCTRTPAPVCICVLGVRTRLWTSLTVFPLASLERYAANGAHRSSYRFVPVMAKRIPEQCTMASAGPAVKISEEAQPTLFGIQYSLVAHSSVVAPGKVSKESLREKVIEYERAPNLGGAGSVSCSHWRATGFSHDPIAKVWFENHCKLLQTNVPLDKSYCHRGSGGGSSSLLPAVISNVTRPLAVAAAVMPATTAPTEAGKMKATMPPQERHVASVALGTLQDRLVACFDPGGDATAGANQTAVHTLFGELLKDVDTIATIPTKTLVQFLQKSSSILSSSLSLLNKSTRLPGTFLLLFHVDESIRQWAKDRVGALSAGFEGEVSALSDDCHDCPGLALLIKRLAKSKLRNAENRKGKERMNGHASRSSDGGGSAVFEGSGGEQLLLNNTTIFSSNTAIFWQGMSTLLRFTTSEFLNELSGDVGAAVGSALQAQMGTLQKELAVPLLKYIVDLLKKLRASFWSWTGFASTGENGSIVVAAALKCFGRLVRMLVGGSDDDDDDDVDGGANRGEEHDSGGTIEASAVHWIAPLVLSVLRCQLVSSEQLAPLITKVMHFLTCQVPTEVAAPIVTGFVELRVDRLRTALCSSEELWGPFLVDRVLEEQQSNEDWYMSDTARLVTGLIERDLRARYACCESAGVLDKSKLVPNMWEALKKKIATPETVNTIGLQIMFSACALGTDTHLVAKVNEAHVYSTVTAVAQAWAQCMSTADEILPVSDAFPTKGLLRLLSSQVETLWRFAWWFTECQIDLSAEEQTRAFIKRVLLNAEDYSSLKALSVHGSSHVKVLLHEGQKDSDEDRILKCAFVTSMIDDHLRMFGVNEKMLLDNETNQQATIQKVVGKEKKQQNLQQGKNHEKDQEKRNVHVAEVSKKTAKKMDQKEEEGKKKRTLSITNAGAGAGVEAGAGEDDPIVIHSNSEEGSDKDSDEDSDNTSVKDNQVSVADSEEEEEEILSSQRKRLKKHKGGGKLSSSSDSSDSSDSSADAGNKGNQWNVDRLIDMKKDHEGIKWLVKWDGFPESEATWQLESQLKFDLSTQTWGDFIGEYQLFKKQNRKSKLDQLKSREIKRRDRKRIIERHNANPDGTELIMSSSSSSDDDDDDGSSGTGRAKGQRPSIFIQDEVVSRKLPRDAGAGTGEHAAARANSKSIGLSFEPTTITSTTKRSSNVGRSTPTGTKGGTKSATVSSSWSAISSTSLKRAKPDGPSSFDTKQPEFKRKRVIRQVTADVGSIKSAGKGLLVQGLAARSRSKSPTNMNRTQTPPAKELHHQPAIFNAHLRVAGGAAGGSGRANTSGRRSASPFASDSDAGSRSSSPATVRAAKTDFLRTVLGLQISELEHGPRVLEQTPTRFESQDEYREKFLKLIVEECRESISSEWRDEGRKTRPSPVRLLERGGKGPDFKIKFQFIRSSFSVGDCDILVVTFKTEAGGSCSCLGLVLGSTSGGRVPEMQLYIPPAGQRSIDITNSLKQETLTFTVQPASNIVTFIRETDAMDRLETSPLMPFVLSGQKPVFQQLVSSTTSSEEKRKEQLLMLKQTLNPSQLQAIEFTTQPNNPISFIQGPPGTGKTKTLVSLLKVIFDQFPEIETAKAAAAKIKGGKRSQSGLKSFSSIPEVARANTSKSVSQKTVMLCAPSNAATDELVRRMTDPASGLALNLVRLGKKESAHEAVVPFLLEEQVQAELGTLRSVCNKFDAMINDTQENLRQVDSELGGFQGRATGGGSHEQMAAYAKMMGGSAGQELRREANHGRNQTEISEQKKKTLLKTLQDQKKKFREAKKEYDKRERTCRIDILQHADVICCTLSSSGLGSIYEAKVRVDIVIVDEAAQCTEPEILIPLQHGCRKLVLVGDPKQLRPTVLSSVADRAGFGRSLFERLHGAATALGCSIMLKQQYRMHPQICAFPSKQFYDSKLVAAAAVSKRAPAPWSVHRELSEPYSFWDVPWGKEERGRNEKSVYNEAEVQACIHLFAELCRGVPSVNFAGRVAFITPYNRQKDKLRAGLQSAFGNQILSAVDVGTVDGFQGQERDVVIFSCVRAGGNHIGFLADQKRMNVALTRAKYSLFVVGKAKTLECDPVWRNLVANAKTRGALKQLPRHSLRVPTARSSNAVQKTVPQNAFKSDKVVVPTAPAGRTQSKGGVTSRTNVAMGASGGGGAAASTNTNRASKQQQQQHLAQGRRQRQQQQQSQIQQQPRQRQQQQQQLERERQHRQKQQQQSNRMRQQQRPQLFALGARHVRPSPLGLQAPVGAIVRGPSSLRPASLVMGAVYANGAGAGSRMVGAGAGAGGAGASGAGASRAARPMAAARSREGSHTAPSSRKKSSKPPSMKEMISGLGTL